MSTVTVINHPLVQHKLALIRNKEPGPRNSGAGGRDINTDGLK